MRIALALAPCLLMPLALTACFGKDADGDARARWSAAGVTSYRAKVSLSGMEEEVDRVLREGFARVNARQALVRLDELERAEAEARSFRRGMWGSAPQTPGTSYTHRSNRARSPSIRSSKTRKTRPKSPKPKT